MCALVRSARRPRGAIDLAETLGREPLALVQASAVVASSNLTCRDYRDLFLQRRDEIWTGPDEIPSTAMVTWILCLERAESLLPSSAGSSSRGAS